MAKKLKKNKKTKQVKFLNKTTCGNCRIRLVVFDDNPKLCKLCESTNIKVEVWQ